MRSILAVDDSPSMRKMVAFTLAGAGFRVVEAVDGVDALEKAQLEQVDLVLADSRERAVALCQLWPDDPHGAHFLSLLAPGSALLAFYQRVA